jgi:hypothetical protein
MSVCKLYHFDGDIDKLFSGETVHLPHIASDYSNQNVVLLPQKYGNLLKANTSPNFETIDRKK